MDNWVDLLESAPEPAFIESTQGLITWANRCLREEFEWVSKVPSGTPVSVLLGPLSSELGEAQLVGIPCSSGQSRWWLRVAVHPKGFALRVGLTDNVEFRSELADFFYRDLPVMMQSTDPEGRLSMVNEAWLNRFCYSREEVLGDPQWSSSRLKAEDSKAGSLSSSGRVVWTAQRLRCSGVSGKWFRYSWLPMQTMGARGS